MALLFHAAVQVLAQGPVLLSQDSWWEISGRQLRIHVSSIANLTNVDTGPLYVCIYARPTAVYEGTGTPGQLIGRALLDNIPAGTQTNDVNLTTRLLPYRVGPKYSTITIEQRVGRRFVILDWNVYWSTYGFTRGQNGGVGSDDSAIGRGNIAVEGVTLSGAGRRLIVDVARIQSQREVDITAPIRLAAYATLAPYDGGALPARPIATRVIGQLSPGDYYQNLHAILVLGLPRPITNYYVTLVVEEQTESGWAPISYAGEAGTRRL